MTSSIITAKIVGQQMRSKKKKKNYSIQMQSKKGKLRRKNLKSAKRLHPHMNVVLTKKILKNPQENLDINTLQ